MKKPNERLKAQRATTQRLRIFDVDGVLTDPKQQMDDKFSVFFSRFCSNNHVILISGSPIEQVKKQIPFDVLSKCVVTFGNMGNEYLFNPMGMNTLIEVENDYSIYIPKELKEELQYMFCYVEDRKHSFYFSKCGQSKHERETYINSCDTVKDRIKLIKHLTKKYGDEYQFMVGGQVGIDMVEKGRGKEQIMDVDSIRLFDKDIEFYGDRTLKYGNDHDIAASVRLLGGRVFQVNNGFKETWMLIDDTYNA